MTPGLPALKNLHATALTFDGVGILITGSSGSGKSVLALDLLEHAAVSGRPAVLIADDQVLLEPRRGQLFAVAPKGLAGRIELRGRGIVTRPHVSPAPLHLVLDLLASNERLPPHDAFSVVLEGVALARAPLPSAAAGDPVHRRLLALEAIAARQRNFKKPLETAARPDKT